MKYHKKLERKEIVKYGWQKIILMVASEFSRADHLSRNGGIKEAKMCILRAKELLGILESYPTIPLNTALKLSSVIKDTIKSSATKYNKLYNRCMSLGSLQITITSYLTEGKVFQKAQSLGMYK